jgi:mono/diheme cytochrome c family protein
MKPQALMTLGALAAVLLVMTLAMAPPAAAQSRGGLLYTTHCSSCHTAMLHWREQKKVRDWAGLLTQVRYWQGQAALAWSDEDIAEVARYLNDTYYKLEPAPQPTVRGRAGPD